MMKKVKIEHSNSVQGLIKSLKENPIFSRYEIDVNNFNMFYIMSEEHEACLGCKSILDCKNTLPGYVHECSNEKYPYTFKAKPCKYKENQLKEIKSHELIETMYMSKGILECELDKFDCTTESRQKVYQYAINFVSQYNRQNFMKGLLLEGAFGVGKTYLLGAIANELSRRNISCILMYFPDLARELKSSMSNGTLEAKINQLKDVDVLMIDDLGGEMLTSWLRDEVLGPILNYRSQEQLPVFISTNLDSNALYKHFEQTKDELYNNVNDTIKAGRILQRIKALSVSCDLGTKSYK